MDSTADLQFLDESRPAKRARLEASLTVTADTQEELIDDDDDWDDIYDATESVEEKVGVGSAGEILPASTALDTTNEVAMSTAPDDGASTGPIQDTSVSGYGLPSLIENKNDMKGELAEVTVSDENELVAPQTSSESTDRPSAKMLEETTEIIHPPIINQENVESEPGDLVGAVQEPEQRSPSTRPGVVAEEISHPRVSNSNLPVVKEGEGVEAKSKPAEDPEFLAAAEGQKSNQTAEWQFDSSDAESSSDPDDSESGENSEESDSGSEGGYEMLDAATAAKILMSGDGDDDDGETRKGKSGVDHQPRTTNEVKETIVPKPEVTITPDMKITFLGVVERTVQNLVLIKGATPGEYQVLEAGSVLCNETRDVIGAVAETLGRVQEPMYSVAFTDEEEIKEAGLEHGFKIFYVDNRSTFVFTQPLRNLKGTDASNIHDEEVGEDEVEFSDDEKEAEYKRQKKLAKKSGREAPSRSAFNKGDAATPIKASGYQSDQTRAFASDVPTQTYGSGMSYDDDDPVEEFYNPLKRPDNLSQLMSGGAPPPRPQRSTFDRGRGRGRGDRGKSRNDRGRGRGGFDAHSQRGGRDDFHANGHRGNAQSFPDRHNNYINEQRRHALPPRPDVSHAAPTSPVSPQQPHHQSQPQNQHQPQAYQFNGYTFQYGNQPPSSPSAPHNYYNQQPAQIPTGPVAAGAYINPAFFPQQAQLTAQPRAHSAWNGQQQQQQYPYLQPQNAPTAAASSPSQAELADILRRLGASQTQ